MTDSMKFGPEWLRNMAADHQANNSTSTASIHANNNNNNNNVNNNNMSNHNSYNNSNNSGVGGGGAVAAARNMFPEFRYGREEMLLLFEKNCPLPEILTSYKSLFVEKAQMPLAMTPSSEDEAPILPPALQSRPNWMQRSPLGFSSTGGVINNIGNGSGGLSVGGVGVSATSIGGGIVRGGGSTRGGGGGSFERGRARGKSTYSMYSRTISGGGGFNDDGTIKEPRPWNERNGNDTTGNGSGNGVTSGIDWNGTPNSSPRKEFSSHTRNIENWRKTRHDNDGTSGVGGGGGGGDAASIVNTMSSQQIANSSISPNMDSSGGWRGSLGGATSSSAFRWGRSTSWRDDDGNLTNESNSVVVSPSPASGTGVAVGVQRSFSGISTDRGALQQHPSTASIGMAANKAVIKTRLNGEVDDNLPEWAMENPLQTGVAGGTFDAAGAFHGSNENDYQNDDEQKQRKVETTTNNSEQQEEETENKDEDEDKVDETTNNSTDNDVENVEIIEHIENVDNIVDETNTTTISDNVVNSEMFKNNIINDGEPQQQHMSNKLLNTLIVQDNNKMKEQDVSNSSSITTITTTTSSETTTSGDNEMAIWFYRDPQAKIQGPFTAMEMCEWHRAGYFNEQLYVRRVCDQRFRTLGELLKLCHGQMPFTHTHLLDTNANNQNTLTTTIISSDKPNLTTTAAMVPTKVTTLQQHLLDGNLLVDQQQQQQHTHYTNMLDNLTAAAESISMACKNLNSIEMSHMLALHFQNLQKKYLQQQEMLIISELNKNECFQRLAQHEKESIIQQKLRLICVPDYLLNLSGLSEALAQHNPIAGLQLYHVIAECNKRTLTEAATTTQTPSLIDELFLQPQQPPPTLAHNMLLQQQQHLQHQQQLIQQQHRSDFMPLTSPTIAAASLVEQEQFMQMWSNSSTSLQQPPILPQTNIQQQILQPTTIPTNPWNLMLNHQNNTVLPQRPVIGGRNSAAVVIANVPTVAQIEKQQQQKHFSNIWQQQQQQSPPLQDQPVLGNSNNMNIQQEQQSADVKMTTPTTSSEKPVQSQQQHETAVKQNAAATKQQQKINKKQTSTEVVATTQPAATNKRANKPQQPPPQVTNNTKLNKKQQHQHQQQLQNDDGGDFQQQQQRRTREQNEELKQQRKQRQQQQQQEDELKAKERELRELAKEKERQQLIQEQRRKALTSGSGGNVVGETTKKSSSSIAPWSMLNMNKKNTSGYDENGDENFMNVGGGELVNVVQPLSLIEIQKAERREQQQQRAAMELQQQQQQALQQQQQLQQQMQQHNLLMQHHDNKWNSPLTNIQVKSFAEIQAEETKRMAILEQQRKQELLLEQQQHHHHNENVLNTNLGHHLQSSSSLVMNATSSSVGGSSSGGGGVMSSIWGANNAWGTTNNNNNNNSSSIWGDDSVAVVGNNKYGSTPPSVAAVLAAGLQQQHQQQQQSKSTSIINNKNSIKKSQTVSTMQQNNNTSSVKINKTIKQQQVAVASAANRAKSETDVNAAKRSAANAGNLKAATTSKQKATTTAADLEKEFTNWCTKSLNNMHAKIDVPTFVGFLHELESPYDIKDYIRMYLGESKECIDFSKQFLERRSKCRSLQRAQNAHNDDMCKPAPAITPCAHDNSDKGKQKKEKKKGKMTKLDARILGFSVTAAAGRINVGDRDYVDGP